MIAGEVFDQLSVRLVIYGPLRLVLDRGLGQEKCGFCVNFMKSLKICFVDHMSSVH